MQGPLLFPLLFLTLFPLIALELVHSHRLGLRYYLIEQGLLRKATAIALGVDEDAGGRALGLRGGSEVVLAGDVEVGDVLILAHDGEVGDNVDGADVTGYRAKEEIEKN
jgi:hypothetical protein